MFATIKKNYNFVIEDIRDNEREVVEHIFLFLFSLLLYYKSEAGSYVLRLNKNNINPIKQRSRFKKEVGFFMKMKKIAIQGDCGSYHDMAAHYFFEGEKIELIFCNTFEDVFTAVESESSVIGMIAIENTIAGSLLHNYELLCDSGFVIAGEHKLRISHSLLALPDDSFDDIIEVHSHPVALMQCRDFLGRHSRLKVVEAEDTAGSAKWISLNQMHGHAAICSKFAAPLYGMHVLKEGIETNKHNFTRFLVFCQPQQVDFLRDIHNANKASLVFTLPHEEGSLSQILSIFSFYKLNLTKIQSLPLVGREWQYKFYVDLTFDDYIRYTQSIKAITPLTEELKILGEYQDGKQTI